uniref:Ubiquitin-like domain-containing protein n=1 Tax=Cucumis sativus TaxID=3659 RepID=A0A0A0L550_CUCSA
MFVRTFAGETFNLEIEPTATIVDVKDQIEDLNGVASYSQRLIFGRKTVEDDKTLEHYQIKNDSTLYLIFRAHGGF